MSNTTSMISPQLRQRLLSGSALIGFFLAYAIVHGNLPRWVRPTVSTFSGVASNFAGIPLAFAADVIHGCRTIFPIPLAEAAAAHGLEDVTVGRGVGDDGDGGVVLRRGAHHRRAADVDLLDALVDARAGRDGLGERVQVDDDEVERCDAELTQLRQVVVLARVGEDARVHLGVQRLDATLEALGETGQLLDGRHRDAETGDELARTTGRDDLDAGVGQGACQLLQTRLVVHRDEGPLDGAQTVTH